MKRTLFLAGGTAALAACATAPSSFTAGSPLIGPARVKRFDTTSMDGNTLSWSTVGDTLTATLTTAAGATSTFLTAVIDSTTKLITFTTPSGSVGFNPSTYDGGSVTAYGHTIAPDGSGDAATITGPLITSGSTTLTTVDSKTGNLTLLGNGTQASGTFTLPPGEVPTPPKGGETPKPAVNGWAVVGAVASGIGLAAGCVALALALPEITVAALVVGLIDIICSFIGWCLAWGEMGDP
jgi:hypothetical protein